MKIFVFGGTTEGRLLAGKLAGLGHAVSLSVATEYGREVSADLENVRIFSGRLQAEEMEGLLAGQDLCVDATHPYAVEATAQIRRACADLGLAYRRLIREKGSLPEGAVCVASAEEAAAWLRDRTGNVLLTTGSKELPAYAELARERLYPRVLPMESSLRQCEDQAVERSHIIAMQGPFSEELNLALIREFDIRFLVTKESGPTGGFAEKCAAAERAGVSLVVITRPEDNGVAEEELLAEIAAAGNA